MMRFSSFSAALVAAIIGFGGTLPLLLTAAEAVGANADQLASWVTVICLCVAIESVVLSYWFKMPIVAAWSATGFAVIGASAGFSMEEAVGSFLITAILLLATGLFKPLAKLVASIPGGISAGMLAGVLFPFVVGGATAGQADPLFVLPLALMYFVVRLWSPPLAVIAVLAIGIGAAFVTEKTVADFALEPSRIVFVMPEFTFAALFGLAIPVYLVNMASQYLPGIAVLRADGYTPPPGPIFAVTAITSVFGAFLASATTNLSAITASICTGPDAHPDKNQRWITGIWYGLFYLVFGIFGASLVSMIAIMPRQLVMLAMAVAILTPLINSMRIALETESERVPAIVTFTITVSGIAFFGVGSPFWGLGAGLLVYLLSRIKAS